jgi:hypothetical protein
MNQIILVSYMPKLRYRDYPTTNEELSNFIKEHMEYPVSAQACVWVSDDNGHVMPVLVYDEADKLSEHLIEWSENDPSLWFDLYMFSKDGKYALVLMPKLEKSVERWKIRFQLEFGYPPPDNIEFDIVFNPLSFVSGTSNMFQNLKNRNLILDRMFVGFVSLKDIDMNNIPNDNIKKIGPLSVVEEPNDYILNLIDNQP